MSTQEYTAPVVAQARQYAAAGFGVREIQRLLEREIGRRPTDYTIRRWLNDGQRQHENARVQAEKTRRRANGATFRLSSNAPAYQHAFIRRLRAQGVPCASIAKVCTVVFDRSWSEYQVRRFLKGDAA